jgi:hypothetical protein
MKHQYMVYCWIYPKSGFDLAQKNKIMEVFKMAMSANFSDDAKMTEEVEKFSNEFKEYILEPIVIESDTEVTDPEKEIMPEIRKEHPEAKLLSIQPMPRVVESESSTNK